jgi:hypothetical protein
LAALSDGCSGLGVLDLVLGKRRRGTVVVEAVVADALV